MCGTGGAQYQPVETPDHQRKARGIPSQGPLGGKQLCTAVTGLVGHNGVIAGFVDGSVLAGRISFENDQEDFVVKGSSGGAISTLVITQQAWLFIGDEAGRVLWVQLGGDDA